jgi:tRNA(Ile)-lysidine synthase
MDWIRINSTWRRRFPSDARYLIGVSGGRDSVALLHWLIEMGYKKLIVCHLNHQLRGRSSDADARFVEKLVANYKPKIVGQTLRLPRSQVDKRIARPTTRGGSVELELGSADVPALAAKNKVSIEAAARDVRYKFFAQIARRKRCREIFLAHHADDLVETFLINLFRGAGPSGLAAMREVSTRNIDRVDLTIVRPLLGVWRSQIDDYIRKHHLKFRDDASNENLAPRRNRIRRRIIPYLERALGRNVRLSVWRAATICAEEERWMDSQLPNVGDRDISVKKLRDLPVALQRREVVRWLRRKKIVDVGFDVTERIRSLLEQDARVAKINLPRDRHVRRRAGKIFVE